MEQFQNVGLGGTFDRLHRGHKLFLDIAAHYGQLVRVGLISSSYLNKIRKVHHEIIQSYEIRKEVVENYISKRNTQCQIISIDNPGMDRELASDAKLSALVVSQETCLGAKSINRLRVTKGKPRLTIIVIPRVLRVDGTLESSTKLREEQCKKGLSD
ncbi:MAG: pantetheine-phosphate adenylyltransferase [Candidatus Thorarchaeota archaeon]